MTTTISTLSRLFVAAFALTTMATLVACDQEDAVSVTLASVGRELSAVHSGGASAAPPNLRMQTYEQAISQLQGATRDGSSAQRDAANMLLAQAHGGMAQIESAEAVEIENRLLDRATRLRALMDLYVSQSALAAALAEINPVTERASLDQALVEVEQRLSEAQRTHRELKAEFDAFETRANESGRIANERRAEAAEWRAKALDSPATEAADMVAKAYEIERSAAGAEQESARETAAKEKVAPRLEELNRLIGSLGDERTSLTEARRRVDQRTQDARQDTQVARAAARAAADEAEVALDEIETIRNGELTERWNQAIRHAQAAATALSQSRSSDSGVRATNAVLRAEAQQRLGEMYATQARGMERYLLLLDLVSSEEPAPPFASRAAGFTDHTETEFMEARQAASEAFEQAASTLQSAGVRDQDVRDRLERLQQMLRSAAGETTAETPAPTG